MQFEGICIVLKYKGTTNASKLHNTAQMPSSCILT